MSHFAHIEQFGIVDQVIVADADFIASLPDSDKWVQTSYNTRGGIHYGEDGEPDNKTPLRKNYAGIGYKYDSDLNAFVPPQPFPSWTLNTQSCLWEPPIPMPSSGGPFAWFEENRQWIAIPSLVI